MAGRRRITREAILKEATAVVVARGTAALTYQALASRLGVSKQAIIYWYPTKQSLARDLVLPSLEAEARATIGALEGANTAAEAIERFVRALIAHHIGDLPRFRYTYLASQLDEQAPNIMAEIMDDVHAVTATMYSALEGKIAVDRSFDSLESPRRMAVAVHMAALGLVTMVSLADAVRDPLAHGTEPLIDALVGLLVARGR